jgi:hypothetical protein
MPSESKAQQRAAGMAVAAKKGEIPVSKLGPAARSMMDMKSSDLMKYAQTKHNKLPEHVSPKQGK